MKKTFILFIILSSCIATETDILSSDQLTVEGAISENNFAEIYLTNSLPFSGIIDSLEVAKSMETKAKVELSNGEISEILTLKRDDSRFPFLYYRSNIIKGEAGKAYDLSISIRNKTFTSKSLLPQKPEVLDVEFIESITAGVSNPDYRDIKLTVNNEMVTPRYFKLLIKNEIEQTFAFAKPFIFNTENIFTNTFPIIVNYTDFDDDTGERINKLSVGETMELKLVAITKAQFNFWKSIKGDESTFIENSSFTNEVASNLTNGAFGYWSGENTENLKITIPEN